MTLLRTTVEAELKDILEVVSNTLYKHIKNVPCVVIEEHNQHDEQAKSKANLTQPPDADLHTSDH